MRSFVHERLICLMPLSILSQRLPLCRLKNCLERKARPCNHSLVAAPRYAAPGRLRNASIPSAAIAANAAPAIKVAEGPTSSHSAPATTLASNIATPLTRLKIPNAVPRSIAGALSATSLESRPWVSPICSPHSAAPAKTCHGVAAIANTRSASTSIASAKNRSVTALRFAETQAG